MQEVLGLFVGDVVEVLSKSEILATLDGNGALSALPFMPEMLKHSGKQFRVFRTAHRPATQSKRPACAR